MGRINYILIFSLLFLVLMFNYQPVKGASSVVGSSTFQSYTGSAKIRFDNYSNHKNNQNNPHGVTTSQIGIINIDGGIW